MTDVNRTKRALLARERLVKVREDIARWVILPELSRALIAQVNYADRLIAQREYEQAAAVLGAIQAGHTAAGAEAYGEAL